MALDTRTIEFLTALGRLAGRAMEPFGLKVAIVVWDETSIQYVGVPNVELPSTTIDMLQTAAYIVHETHEREEGHA